jgi:hypothetical protein
MNHTVYNHADGFSAVPENLRTEIEGAIAGIEVRPERGAASRIRDAFLQGILTAGWSGEVSIAQGTNISITSMKGATGLCLQTGNMSRVYADLIKLHALYLDGAISAAIIVVPSQPVAKLIGDNIAQATRLERELPIFRKAYNVPTLVYALE